jgi:hypothetical protein
MIPPTASKLLSDAMLKRFREREPGDDRENRFFREDFDELRQASYLAIAVPRDARLSRIHPANSALTHEVVAKLTLGIDPDAQPRWG